ncbi:MAG: efflux RND transporter periplasmic adaptor subunit [Filomicrobium sp.]
MSGTVNATETPPARGTLQRVLRTLLSATVVLSATALFIGLAAGGIALLHARAQAEPKHEIAPPVGVTTQKLQLVDGYDRVAGYTGRLEPARETNVAFERAGLILSIAPDEGDKVSAGDVIAKLDTARLKVNRQRLEARQRELAAQLKLADLTLGRQSKLEKRGWSPEQRLDEARTNRSQLLAGIDQVKAEIAALDIDLEKSELRAPFGGKIASRFVDEGAVVAAGTAVVRLLESDRRQARIGLPPQLAATLNGDQTYTLVAGAKKLAAKLSSQRPDLQTGTRTVTVLFEVADGANGVAFGDLVRLDLKTRVKERGAWVPLVALKEGRRGLWTILTVDRSDGSEVVRPESVEVLYSRGDEVFVRGTFRDGAEILTNGTDRVVAGQRVARVQE